MVQDSLLSLILHSHLQLSEACETLAPKRVSRQLGFCTLSHSFCTDVNYWIWHKILDMAAATELSGSTMMSLTFLLPRRRMLSPDASLQLGPERC